MKILTPEGLGEWMNASQITYEPETLSCSFVGAEELMFRIPIGDYKLQLDYRIQAALSLFPNEDSLVMFRKDLRWGAMDHPSAPLHAFFRAIGIHECAGGALVDWAERDLAFVVAYLTNRWGTSGDSFYMASEKIPDKLLFIPGSPESVFVICQSSRVHEDAVARLCQMNVPAYGRAIPRPLAAPVYDDVNVGRSIVTVDPETGKPIGPGSPESALLPEFLPPD